MIDRDQADLLLTTTRSVRKRLDFSRPVPDELVLECIEVALQAPTGSNAQGWSFVVVTDEAKRRAIAEIYAKAFALYRTMPDPEYAADDPRAASRAGVVDSASYLADHMHEASHLFIPCIEGRVEEAGLMAQASVYGSVLPAAWSCIPMMTSSDMSVATISPVRSLLGSSAWDHTVCGPIPRPAMNPM